MVGGRVREILNLWGFKGEEISHSEMGKLMLTSHKTLPAWNYTLAPLKM
jgi:hypothetical protein